MGASVPDIIFSDLVKREPIDRVRKTFSDKESLLENLDDWQSNVRKATKLADHQAALMAEALMVTLAHPWVPTWYRLTFRGEVAQDVAKRKKYLRRQSDHDLDGIMVEFRQLARDIYSDYPST